MHPDIEILFSLFLAFFGMLMMRKLSSLKRKRTSAIKKSYAIEKYFVISRKISFKFMMVLFTLMIVAITILIKKGVMTVTW